MTSTGPGADPTHLQSRFHDTPAPPPARPGRRVTSAHSPQTCSAFKAWRKQAAPSVGEAGIRGGAGREPPQGCRRPPGRSEPDRPDPGQSETGRELNDWTPEPRGVTAVRVVAALPGNRNQLPLLQNLTRVALRQGACQAARVSGRAAARIQDALGRNTDLPPGGLSRENRRLPSSRRPRRFRPQRAQPRRPDPGHPRRSAWSAGRTRSRLTPGAAQPGARAGPEAEPSALAAAARS